MLNQCVKAGATLVILSVGGFPALAQTQADVLGASATTATQIVTVKTTPEKVAFIKTQPDRVAFKQPSGKEMPPLPNTGNLAMLITGLCLAGVAASRRKVAA